MSLLAVYSFFGCILPSLIGFAIFAFAITRVSVVRDSDYVRRCILFAVVVMTFFANYLIQTNLTLRGFAGVSIFYAESAAGGEVDPTLYLIEAELTWRYMIIPPSLRQYCSPDYTATAWCVQIVPPNESDTHFQYFFFIIITGMPASVMVYFAGRHLLGPWRKQKRKSKDDFVAQPG